MGPFNNYVDKKRGGGGYPLNVHVDQNLKKSFRNLENAVEDDKGGGGQNWVKIGPRIVEWPLFIYLSYLCRYDAIYRGFCQLDGSLFYRTKPLFYIDLPRN